MKITAVVIGFGLVAAGRIVFGFLRANYLKKASVNVSIDHSREIVLRHAIWDSTFALLLIAGSIFMGWSAFHTAIPMAIVIYKIACVFCFVGGIFLSYLWWSGRVMISNGKLIYTEGADRFEIAANEVDSVTLNGFTFIVKKRSDKIVRVPATFAHSEIILAFLNQAAVNK